MILAQRLFTFSQCRLVRTITTELHIVSHQRVYDALSTLCPLSILKRGKHKVHFLRAVHVAKSFRLFYQLQC